MGGGGAITFTCIAIGRPIPTVTWFHDDVIVHSVSNSLPNPYTTAALLNIDAVPSNNGAYRCVAFNSHGNDFADTLLIVIGKYECSELTCVS